MNERDWLSSTDPAAMLEYVRGKVSDRKLRLFACSCCRLVWDRITDPRGRMAVEVAERYADGEATEQELDIADYEATEACYGLEDSPGFATAWVAHQEQFLLAAERLRSQDGAIFDKQVGWVQADLLRCVAGNPWRPWMREDDFALGKPLPGKKLNIFWLSWLTPNAIAIARAAYTDRDWNLLPVLADALEDGGCDSANLLAHLRAPGPHCRGCHCLDLVLGLEWPP